MYALCKVRKVHAIIYIVQKEVANVPGTPSKGLGGCPRTQAQRNISFP